MQVCGLSAASFNCATAEGAFLALVPPCAFLLHDVF